MRQQDHRPLTGRARRDAGFTLIELLVVLAIVGFVLVLVPGFLLRGQPGLDVEVAAHALAGALREARADAMQHNREQLFALDVEERIFRAGPDRPPLQIDRAIEVTFQTARQEQLGGLRLGASARVQVLQEFLRQRFTLAVDRRSVTIDAVPRITRRSRLSGGSRRPGGEIGHCGRSTTA